MWTYLTVNANECISMAVELLLQGDHNALEALGRLLSDVVGNLHK